jgi:hypothetical protein
VLLAVEHDNHQQETSVIPEDQRSAVGQKRLREGPQSGMEDLKHASATESSKLARRDASLLSAFRAPLNALSRSTSSAPPGRHGSSENGGSRPRRPISGAQSHTEPDPSSRLSLLDNSRNSPSPPTWAIVNKTGSGGRVRTLKKPSTLGLLPGIDSVSQIWNQNVEVKR